MPYGASELKEAFRRYLAQGVIVGSAAWILLFLLGSGGLAWLAGRPHEVRATVIIDVLPPPLTPIVPSLQPPAVRQPVAPSKTGVAVAVPDIQAPPDHTFASQDEIGVNSPGPATGPAGMVLSPGSEDLPAPNDFVYAEELPVVIAQVNPSYPEIAREAGVDGTVVLKALVDKEGKVRDVI